MVSYGCVEGDALEAMQAAWNERDSFTRDELGGVAPYWEWVSRAGFLFTRRDAEILTSESLDECYPSLTVGGVELLAGDIVESTSPALFGECVDADVYMRISEGEWRPIE